MPLNKTNTELEFFDVFLCHNWEDKPEIREIADELDARGLKPWLDEREIRPGMAWQSALQEQMSSIKSAAIFVGKSGVGPWQDVELQYLINAFVKRKCLVIPCILKSAQQSPKLPWSLENLQYVDFRISKPDPLDQLIWGITGKKSNIRGAGNNRIAEPPALVPEREKQVIEIRVPGDLDAFSSNDKEKLLAGIAAFLQIDGQIKIIASRSGSIRLFLELTPEEADKLYAASKNGQLESMGVTDARLYPSLADPPDNEHRSQLLILLNRVKEFWVDGVLKQSLHHEVLISLGKRAMDEAVEPPWNRTVELPKQRHTFSLTNTRIETVFDATGLLLILGEPGSGKTTTLLELLSILIARAETDSKERIPIVLNLSSWKKQQALTEWIVEKLSSVYSVPGKLARVWLEKGYIILLLDGLDEANAENQADCVEAINDYITLASPPGLVVCSRLMEYQWLPERLKLNGAICIEPLNHKQIEGYFSAIGAEFELLRMAIQEDAVLQELAQSPLMLNIMTLAYRSAEPQSLADKGQSLEDRRTQIFDVYIDKMFERKESLGQAFPKGKTIFWLGWLAKMMTEQSQSVFFVENLQPTCLDSLKDKVAYRGLACLNLGVMVALILCLIFIILGFLTAFTQHDDILPFIVFIVIVGPPSLGFIAGLIFWVLSILTAVVGIDVLNTVKTIEAVTWSWRSFFKSSLKGFLIGSLILGAGGGFYAFYDAGLGIGFIVGVMFGLIGGLMGGLISGFIGGFTDKIREDKSSPNQGIILTLKNGFFTWFMAALILCLSCGLIGLSIGRIEFWLIVGIFAGIILGMIVGLNRGLGAVIKHYSLRLILWRSGKTPFKLIPFLDYGAKLILLKKVGGGYIFIHRMLLEHFAKIETTDGGLMKGRKMR